MRLRPPKRWTPSCYGQPRKAQWWTRCKAHFSHTPSLNTLLCVWIDNIQMLLQWQPLEHLVQPLLQFRHFVQEYNEIEVLPAPELSWWAQRVPKSPPSEKKKQSQHAEQTASVMERIHAMEAVGWVTGYTDGSAKLHPPGGWSVGMGHAYRSPALSSRDTFQLMNHKPTIGLS